MKSKLGSALAINRLFFMSVDVGESSVTSFYGFFDSSDGSLILGAAGVMPFDFFILSVLLGDLSPSFVPCFLRSGETEPMAMILVGDYPALASSYFSSNMHIHLLFWMSNRWQSFSSLVTSKMPPKIIIFPSYTTAEWPERGGGLCPYGSIFVQVR